MSYKQKIYYDSILDKYVYQYGSWKEYFDTLEQAYKRMNSI